MSIKGSYTSKRTGKMTHISYEEVASFEKIGDLPVYAAGAFCFYNDKLVLVYAEKRKTWEIPGGGREEGESFEECVTREIREESNMKVLELIPLGYDTFTYDDSDEVHCVLRYAARVEPYGEFLSDGSGDGEITQRTLIDPADYKKYFDWGERSDVMLKKAMEVLGVQ